MNSEYQTFTTKAEPKEPEQLITEAQNYGRKSFFIKKLDGVCKDDLESDEGVE